MATQPDKGIDRVKMAFGLPSIYESGVWPDNIFLSVFWFTSAKGWPP